jgi:hypothetical protein
MCDYFDSGKTVGTLLHTRWRIDGMTTIIPCQILSDTMIQRKIRKNELFSLFFIFLVQSTPSGDYYYT